MMSNYRRQRSRWIDDFANSWSDFGQSMRDKYRRDRDERRRHREDSRAERRSERDRARDDRRRGYYSDYPRRRPRIYKSTRDRVFAGVCGGIAEHFNVEPWGVRLLFIILTLMGMAFVPPVYVIMAWVLKTAPDEHFTSYEQEEFWNTFQSSRSDALRKVHRSFEMLDKRLQRMESIVTKPAFELEEEWRNL